MKTLFALMILVVFSLGFSQEIIIDRLSRNVEAMNSNQYYFSVVDIAENEHGTHFIAITGNVPFDIVTANLKFGIEDENFSRAVVIMNDMVFYFNGDAHHTELIKSAGLNNDVNTMGWRSYYSWSNYDDNSVWNPPGSLIETAGLPTVFSDTNRVVASRPQNGCVSSSDIYGWNTTCYSWGRVSYRSSGLCYGGTCTSTSSW